MGVDMEEAMEVATKINKVFILVLVTLVTVESEENISGESNNQRNYHNADTEDNRSNIREENFRHPLKSQEERDDVVFQPNLRFFPQNHPENFRQHMPLQRQQDFGYHHLQDDHQERRPFRGKEDNGYTDNERRNFETLQHQEKPEKQFHPHDIREHEQKQGFPRINIQLEEHREPEKHRESEEHNEPEEHKDTKGHRESEHRELDDYREQEKNRQQEGNKDSEEHRESEHRGPYDHEEQEKNRQQEENKESEEQREPEENREPEEHREPENRQPEEHKEPKEHQEAEEHREPESPKQDYRQNAQEDNESNEDPDTDKQMSSNVEHIPQVRKQKVKLAYTELKPERFPIYPSHGQRPHNYPVRRPPHIKNRNRYQKQQKPHLIIDSNFKIPEFSQNNFIRGPPPEHYNLPPPPPSFPHKPPRPNLPNPHLSRQKFPNNGNNRYFQGKKPDQPYHPQSHMPGPYNQMPQLPQHQLLPPPSPHKIKPQIFHDVPPQRPHLRYPVPQKEPHSRYPVYPKESGPRYPVPSKESGPRHPMPPQEPVPNYQVPPKESGPSYPVPPQEPVPNYPVHPKESVPSYPVPQKESVPSYPVPQKEIVQRYPVQHLNFQQNPMDDHEVSSEQYRGDGPVGHREEDFLRQASHTGDKALPVYKEQATPSYNGQYDGKTRTEITEFGYSVYHPSYSYTFSSYPSGYNLETSDQQDKGEQSANVEYN